MSGYVKWEDVEELLHTIKHRDHYYDHSDRYMELDQEVNSMIEELKSNLLQLDKVNHINNFNITFEYNDHSKAEDFAKRFVQEVKLKELF